MNHRGRLTTSHKSPATRSARSHDGRGVPDAGDEDFPMDFYGAGGHTATLAAALSGDPAFYGVHDGSNSIEPVADKGEGVATAWAANAVAAGVAPAAVFRSSAAGPRTVNTAPGAAHAVALAAAHARGHGVALPAGHAAAPAAVRGRGQGPVLAAGHAAMTAAAQGRGIGAAKTAGHAAASAAVASAAAHPRRQGVALVAGHATAPAAAQGRRITASVQDEPVGAQGMEDNGVQLGDDNELPTWFHGAATAALGEDWMSEDGNYGASPTNTIGQTPAPSARRRGGRAPRPVAAVTRSYARSVSLNVNLDLADAR